MEKEQAAAGGHRFVPSGVDAQSWIGFEARIQERRYRALLNTINIAIVAGDGLSARTALEEAQELRPGAPELVALASRVALVPVAVPAADMSAGVWSRAFGAVALLLVGVAFLIGIDWLHPDAAPSATLQAPVSAPAQQPLDVADVRAATPAGIPAPAATPVDAPASAPAPTPRSITPEPQPVATVGVTRVATLEEPGSAIAPRRPFQPAAVREPAVPTGGEIPDDYVAAPAGRESRIVAPAPQAAPSPAPASAPYADVLRQPTSVVNPLATSPAAAASAAVIAPPRADENRVAQVLNRYASAYGSLDASAAHAVWPSVDERALARAFSSLQSQTVSFDTCDINVVGTTANASCRGHASYVAKVGSREPRSEARTWNFALRRGGDGWTIENAEARRVADVEQR